MMSSLNERLQILEMIDSGVISAQEGARLLGILEGQVDNSVGDDEASPSIHLTESSMQEPGDRPGTSAGSVIDEPSSNYKNFDAHIDKWKRWWMIPLWVGVGITIFGALLMFWAYQASGFSFWFGCAWLPLMIGIGAIILAWSTRTARWLHLRVQQKPGERPQSIAISFPLPLRLTAWFLRIFRNKIPKIGNSGVDELILAIGESTDSDNPFYIEVDEGDEGERVQIYIG
ncbi:MAG: SHOCT-like domain-containing protein [Anaerolineales bacterium]